MEVIFLRTEMAPYTFWETLLKETGTFDQFGYNWWWVCHRICLSRKKFLFSFPQQIKHSQQHYTTIVLRLYIIEELMSKTGPAPGREQSLTGEAPWGQEEGDHNVFEKGVSWEAGNVLSSVELQRSGKW